MDDILMMLQIF